MKLTDFEAEVIELGHQGVRLTVANVVARLRVKPDQAEKWLDELARAGKLDTEIDEQEAVLVYRVRGLTVTRPAREERLGSALRPLRDGAMKLAAAGAIGSLAADEHKGPLPPEERKSMLAGVLLGGLVPGVGLFYAAPLKAAVVVTVTVALVFGALGMLGAIPIIGGLFKLVGSLVWVVTALTSALMGALYVRGYNRNGRRTALSDKVDPKHRLPI